MDKIGHLKRLLHGRQRKRMRLAMSKRIKEMESLIAAKKLGQLIQRLLPDYTDPLDFNQLKDRDGTLLPTPAAADKAASRTMRDWMAVPANLNGIANSFETLKDLWIAVLRGLFCTVPTPSRRMSRVPSSAPPESAPLLLNSRMNFIYP